MLLKPDRQQLSSRDAAAATSSQLSDFASKVPAATVGFWIIKILATTLGEVGGNLVSMDLGFGYLQATIMLFALFAALAGLQVIARRFHAPLYWATIVASTVAGTTLADYVTRSVGIGYSGGSLLLFGLVLISLFSWRATLGRVSADDISDRRAEIFYWVTITFSQTLGTALGDWFADTAGFGYAGSAVVFGSVLLLIVLLHARRSVDGILLFWAAFILTRPLGAVVGNFFDKSTEHGGLAISRSLLSVAMAAMIVVAIVIFPQRAKQAG